MLIRTMPFPATAWCPPPCFSTAPVYAFASYRCSPRRVISVSIFTDRLFLLPSCRHYCLGDHHVSGYRNRGYCSCFNFHKSRRGCGPVYAYNRWSHRHDRKRECAATERIPSPTSSGFWKS